MISCRESRERIPLYIDNELSPSELIEFERHLVDCARCRAEYEDARAVTDAIRGAHPVYELPVDAAQRGRAVLERVEHSRRSRWLAIAAALTVAVATGALALIASWRDRTPEFPAFAAGVHLRYARATLPLDIVSSDPDTLSRWLRKRLPFHVDLPDYPVAPGAAKPYKLVGARLLQFGGGQAGYLAYEMAGKPISLLVASAPQAAPAGGDTYRSGRLRFHFYQRDGLEMISWADRGLYYCLASEIRETGARSCIVCHGGAGERRLFENLTPQRRQ